MSTANTAKDKFGFSNREVATYLIAYRHQLDSLRRTRPWLYENLPALLGVSMKQWGARRFLYRLLFQRMIIRTFRSLVYCQIGKRVVLSVIIDTIRASGRTEEAQKEALKKIKEAIAFFEPVPVLRPGGPSGEVDAVHKEWADKLAFQEIKRIEEHVGVPYYDYTNWPPTKTCIIR